MSPNTDPQITVERHESGDKAGGKPCPGCRRTVPVRAKRPDEVTTYWECTGCRSRLTGVLLKEAVPLLAAHIHLGQKHFDTSGLPPLPAALRQLVDEFQTRRRRESRLATERRRSVRVPHQLDVVAVPLDDDWTPQGRPILGIVVDLAPHGLGMITAARIEAPYVVAQIRHGRGFVQLLGKIIWSKEYGHSFYNAGVQFVVRFGPRQGMRRA